MFFLIDFENSKKKVQKLELQIIKRKKGSNFRLFYVAAFSTI